MPQINASWADLAEGSSIVRTGASAMRGELDSFDGDIRSKLFPTWDGKAQQAYNTRQAQWTAAANNIETVLLKFVQSLATSGDGYSTAEGQNEKTLSV